MPKSQFIDPKDTRKAGFLTFGNIPLNQYNKTITEERKTFSDDDLVRIYRDMVIIREFENMLNDIKVKTNITAFLITIRGPLICRWDRKQQPWAWLTCSPLMI
jgi:2-oxoisovalerate dehydrogenase E1 component